MENHPLKSDLWRDMIIPRRVVEGILLGVSSFSLLATHTHTHSCCRLLSLEEGVWGWDWAVQFIHVIRSLRLGYTRWLGTGIQRTRQRTFNQALLDSVIWYLASLPNFGFGLYNIYNIYIYMDCNSFHVRYCKFEVLVKVARGFQL